MTYCEAQPTNDLIAADDLDRMIAERDQTIRELTEIGERLHAMKGRGLLVPPVELYDSFGGGRTSWIRPADVRDPGPDVAEIVRLVDRSYWQRLATSVNLDALLSEKKRGEIDEQLYSSGRGKPALPPFDDEHVRGWIAQLVNDAPKLAHDIIEAAYRGLSWNYKTNQPHKLGAKIILGGILGWHVGSAPFTFWNCERLIDLEKAINLVMGRRAVDRKNGIRALEVREFGEWVEVPHPDGAPLWSLKVFRNRNGHVKIAPHVVERLNKALAERYPNALPPKR